MAYRIFFIMLVVCISALMVVFNTKREYIGEQNSSNTSTEIQKQDITEKEEESGEDEKEKQSFRREFFEKYIAPDHNLSVEERLEKVNSVLNLPSEPESDMPVNNWYFMGPYGNLIPSTGAKWSGRITDIEPPVGSRTLRVASESGGIWRMNFLPVPVSDNLNCMWIGSFCSHPTDDNTIFAGTGVPYKFNGIGLWKTNNLGATWTQVALSPTPSAFHKVRYQPGNVNIMHIASDNGYYRSINGGTTWTRTLTGVVTDLTFKPGDANVIYAGRSNSTNGGGDGNGGIYKSTNNGVNWTKLTSSPLPITNVLDVRLSHTAANPNIVCASIVRMDNHSMLGVYKTSNDGVSWSNISPVDNIHGTQGSQHNDIRISPLNSNNIIVAGVYTMRSTNSGVSWSYYPVTTNLHYDVHYIHWTTDNTVYICSDGGVSTSTDGGNNWSTSTNIFPVTQVYTIATPKNEKYVVSGGTQDNGSVVFLPNGTWWFGTGCDGGEVAIDPANTANVYSFAFCPGVFRHKSNNYMNTYSIFNSGLPVETDWTANIGHDMVAPVILFTDVANKVYRSDPPYNTWSEMGSFAYPIVHYHGMGVSKYVGSTTLYSAMNNPSPNSLNKLKVYDVNVWSERSSGLPSDRNISKVSTHPASLTKAFCTVQSPGRIYKTTNKGIAWSNITGNLPDVYITGVLSHPTNDNILVAATHDGMFKTTNAGAGWFKWTNGMSQFILVTDISFIDSTALNSRFYAVISTYGRGFFHREISGDELVPAGNNNSNIPGVYSLSQNYPNPFNPLTTISFDLPKQTNVKLTIYNALGKEIQTLINENRTAGSHRVQWDASASSSGIYFYKVEAGVFTETKKMILVK